MKAYTTIRTMVLVAIATMICLSVSATAFAKAGPTGAFEAAQALELEAAKPIAETIAEPEYDIRVITPLEMTELPAAENPEADHEAQADEFEELPAGSEGDVGDVEPDDSEDPVPPAEHADPSDQPTQPPISVVTTRVPGETTHHDHPHRDHLAFTGGAQVTYLLGGALILLAAAGAFLLGRGKKQGEQQ
jgi:hypothetical protein